MENLKPIKVAVAEDTVIIQELLKIYFKSVPDIEIVIYAENGKVLLEKMNKSEVDVVLMDRNMDVMDGIEATQEIRKMDKDIKVIAYSGIINENSVLQMVRAGANGYLEKKSSLKELKKAIYIVEKEGYYFNNLMTKSLLKNAMDQIKPGNNIIEVILKEIEKTIIICICNGMDYIAIGKEVFLSPTTIPRCKAKIMVKIGAEDDLGILKFALKRGLISLSDL